MKRYSYLFCSVLVIGYALGCASTASPDDDERTPSGAPTVEFDPANGVLPLPTNLVVDPATGLLDLPAQCNESDTAKQTREQVLNQLNGFGTFKPFLQLTFSEAPDPDSLTDRVFLFRVQRAGVPDNPAQATPVPFVAQPSQTTRFDDQCMNPQAVDSIVLVPLLPLDDSSTYVVAVLDGVTTKDGTRFINSGTWELVRLKSPPVVIERSGNNVTVVENRTPFDPSVAEDLASLVGLSDLWAYHSTFLPFIDAAVGVQTNSGQPIVRDELLVAWAFNTQTIVAPLDPGVTGSPAELAGSATSNQTVPADLVGGVPALAIMEGALCLARGGEPSACALCGVNGGTAPCNSCIANGGAVPCSKVAFVKTGQFEAPNYQLIRNTLPSVWDNPLTPTKQRDETLTYLAFVPNRDVITTGDFPVVIFAHGNTRSRDDLFLIASQFANFGIATISINWVAHGDRAVKISNEGVCADATDPTKAPQCYAPIASADFASTRDSMRQSVLDIVKLIEVIKAKDCGDETCSALDFPLDPTRIGYIGQSLGGILGVTANAVSPDIKAAVINVGAVGFVDVTINSERPEIVCPLVDALIVAGVLQGTIGQPDFPDDALCRQDSWKTDPAFLQVANTARWITDPFDGANFAGKLRAGPTAVLVQEVLGDQFVPNSQTEALGLLLGLTPQAGNFNDGTGATPSPGAASPGQNLWLTYETRTQGPVTNTYNHVSLLGGAGIAGGLATQQMQTDAITFLVTNLTAQ